MKISSKYKGIIGEFIARMYLRLKFYKVIRKNLQMNSGEIDILAKHNNTLVAIEVKLRSSKRNLKYSITKKQYKRIANSLLKISESYPNLTDLRIDGVFITIKPFSIEHITLDEDSLK